MKKNTIIFGTLPVSIFVLAVLFNTQLVKMSLCPAEDYSCFSLVGFLFMLFFPSVVISLSSILLIFFEDLFFKLWSILTILFLVVHSFVVVFPPESNRGIGNIFPDSVVTLTIALNVGYLIFSLLLALVIFLKNHLSKSKK